MTLYEELKAAGVEISNHESDLYFPVTDVAVAILNKPEHETHRKIATTFLDNGTGAFWFDVPFAFEPWWEQRISSDLGRAEIPATIAKLQKDVEL